MRKVTIIHFVYTLYGGVASVAANIINYHNELGYNHLVVFVEDSDAFDEMVLFNYEKKKVTMYKFPGYSMLFGMRVRKIYHDYTKEHPDEIVIVHTHNIQTLGLLGMWNKIPLICTLHSLNGSEKNLRKSISNYLYKCILKRLIENNKIVTSVSRAIINEYAKIEGVEQIQVVNNGSEIDASKKLTNKNSRELIIGHVGNISYAKGWDTIWEAYCKLPIRYKNKVKFISIGKELDFTKEQIDKMIVDQNLEGRVIYQGFINNAKDNFIPKLDVLALVSRNEAFGLVQVEAMGYGIPVIGRDTGGICEILKNNYNGFVIDTSDEMSEKIKMLVDDRDLYNRLSTNALKTYSEGFTIEKMASKYKSLYDIIINTTFER